MKSLLTFLLGIVAAIGLAAVYVKPRKPARMYSSTAPLVFAPPVQPRPLGEFIDILMQDCGDGKSSDGGRRTLARQIQRAAENRLTGLDRHGFVAALCLETRMGSVKRARSSAGAIGVAQVMPATGIAEAKRCGIGEIVADDLYDNELNLEVAACHYAELVRVHGSEIAPLAYNSGGASEAVKRAKRLLPSGNTETMGYGAIHGIIMSRYLTGKE